MRSGIHKDLAGVVGKDGVLSTPEDLAVYGYDGTFVEGNPQAILGGMKIFY